jgi:hypothetical protein
MHLDTLRVVRLDAGENYRGPNSSGYGRERISAEELPKSKESRSRKNPNKIISTSLTFGKPENCAMRDEPEGDQ